MEITRPRGTIPVRLPRHGVAKLLAWLDAWEGPPRTFLGVAGMPQVKLDREELAIEQLKAALRPKKTGRPRSGVATYMLPTEGLMLLNSPLVALDLPRALRPIIWSIDRQLRKKPGVHFSDGQKATNIANGFYAPETVRRYQWEAKKNRKPARAPRSLTAFKSTDKLARKARILDVVPLMAVLANVRK